MGFRRPGRPGGQHRTRLVCFLGAALGLSLVAAGTRVGADGPLMSRVSERLAARRRRSEIPPTYAPIEYGWVAQLSTPAIRTAGDLAAVEEVEQHSVSLAGYIVRVIPVPIHLAGRRATEWEFHLHLRLGPPRRCEYQDDPRNLVAVVTPPFQPPHTGWDLDVLYELCTQQARVRVSDWLLYDYLSAARLVVPGCPSGASTRSPRSRSGTRGTGTGTLSADPGPCPSRTAQVNIAGAPGQEGEPAEATWGVGESLLDF